MQKIVINVFGDYFYTKKVYIDGNFVGNIRTAELKIDKPENAKKIKVEFLGGLFSTEYEIPADDNSYLLEFSRKSHRIFNSILIAILAITILDVTFTHFMSGMVMNILLCGIILFYIIYSLVTRKNRYSVSARKIHIE